MFQSVPDPIFMDICGNKFCRILCHIRTISHGNPMCHKFKHFHIISAIPECIGIFLCDSKRRTEALNAACL